VQFQVADLPVGRDPADVYRDDPEALVRSVTRATPFLEFRLDRLLDASDIATLEGRARAAQHAAVLVAQHPNDLVRDQYVMKLAGRLDIDADRLRETVARAHNRPHVASVRTAVEPAPAARSVDRRELDALRWAVLAPELMSGRLDTQFFADPVARAAFDALTQWPWHECLEQAPPDSAALLQRLAVEDPGVTDAATEVVTRVVVNIVEAAAQRVLADMLRHGDERSSELKPLLDALVRERSDEKWQSAESIAEQLVGWITDGGND
jgi:DNA primase